MRRIRRRKVLYGSMLSLIILMSFSLSCLKTFALDQTISDASVVLPVDKPSDAAGWLMIYNQTNPSHLFDIPPYTATVRGPTSALIWWANINYDSNKAGYSDPTFINGYHYEDEYDFTIGKVYTLTFTFNFTAQAGSVPEPDFSKMYIIFARSGWSTTKQWTLSDFYEPFAPSSIEVASNQGIAGTPVTAKLTYSFPVYPASTFPDHVFQHDGAGFDYISFDALYFWDAGVFWDQNRYVNWQETTTSGIYRWQERIQMFSIEVHSMSPEEYRDRLIQGSVDQLSDRIDANGDKISQAVSDAADSILNAGDPFDTSDFDDFHTVETQIGQNLMSTHPFSAQSTGRVFNLTAVNRFVAAMNAMSDWYTYLYDYNTLAYAVIFFSLAAHLVYLTFKFLI